MTAYSAVLETHARTFVCPRGRTRTSRALPIFLALVVAGGIAQAADYFVATNGSDSYPGTEGEPWRTVQKAADTVAAGDTVHIKQGTYNERITINVSGSAAEGYVTFRNCSNDMVIIDGTGFNVGSPWGGQIQALGRSYVRIQGLHITNTYGYSTYQRGAGILFYGAGSHIEIVGNEVAGHVGGNAIGCWDELTNVLIADNEVHDCDTGNQEAIRINHDVYYFRIIGNRVHDNSNIGIDCVAWGVQPAYGLIQSNICYRNGLKADGAHGIYIDGGTYITVQDNLCYDNWGGISVGAEFEGEIAHHNIVRRNIAYSNWRHGMGIGGSSLANGRVQDCVFVHNTVCENNTSNWSAALTLNFCAGTNRIQNNIFRDVKNVTPPKRYMIDHLETNNPGIFFLDYNCYDTDNASFGYHGTAYSTFLQWQAATGQDSNSLAANMGAVDITNRNFHLRSDSACVDAGDFLTRTRNSGSGTQLPVEDATFFCDGYSGLFPGDLIRVGASGPVSVVSVDYTNNLITVDQGLSWSNQAGVSLAYIGPKPDMGAYEHRDYWAWAGAITNGLTNYTQCATGDGYPNLLKYVTGSSATHPDDLGRLSAYCSNGVRALAFHRDPAVADATMIVEGSASLSNGAPWTGIATNLNGSWGDATNVVEPKFGNPVVVTVQDDAETADPNRFLRVKVTRP